MSDGKTRRDTGTAAVLAAATAPHRTTYKEHAVAALADLIERGRPFCSDDIHALIPPEVTPHSPNIIPALIGSAAARCRIAPAGWVSSTRPTRHASRNRLWIAVPLAA